MILRFTICLDQEDYSPDHGDLVIDPEYIFGVIESVSQHGVKVAHLMLRSGIRVTVYDNSRSAQERWIKASGEMCDEEDDGCRPGTK